MTHASEDRPDRAEDAALRPIAVALAYDQPGRELPRITATGRGAVARRILDLAFEAGVPVRRDGDLAELLEKSELGEEIPLEAMYAVAEVLSYLYRLNALRRPGGGR